MRKKRLVRLFPVAAKSWNWKYGRYDAICEFVLIQNAAITLIWVWDPCINPKPLWLSELLRPSWPRHPSALARSRIRWCWQNPSFQAANRWLSNKWTYHLSGMVQKGYGDFQFCLVTIFLKRLFKDTGAFQNVYLPVNPNTDSTQFKRFSEIYLLFWVYLLIVD